MSAESILANIVKGINSIKKEKNFKTNRTMTDKEVLQKAIEIAIEKGMSPRVIDKGTFYQLYFLVNGRGGKKIIKDSFNLEDCYGLIFSHGFAKAFWGEELLFAGKPIKGLLEDPPGQVFKTKDLCQKAWRYHLQQMVLEENPINYLRKFVEEEQLIIDEAWIVSLKHKSVLYARVKGKTYIVAENNIISECIINAEEYNNIPKIGYASTLDTQLNENGIKLLIKQIGL